MAEDENHSDVPPGTVFALHVPECFFWNAGIPDQEILGERDVGVKNGKSEEQHTGVMKSLFVNDSTQWPRALEKQSKQVDCAESHPNASGKIVNAIHGGEPLVLQ